MLRFTKKTLLLFAVLALVAAACGSSSDDTTTTDAGPAATTTTAPAATTTTAPGATTTTVEAMDVTPVKTCLVTDLAGVDDKSFNASSWQGVLDAIDAGYATPEPDSFFLESDVEADWQPNIDQMIGQGCGHIVTVGFALDAVTQANAPDNPDINWTIVDVDFFDFSTDPITDVTIDNVIELTYQTDEAAFLAGYVAASVTESGVIGTFGGANFPTVSIFMDGLFWGVQHWNDVKGDDVRVLGWDPANPDTGLFTGNFTDLDIARATAQSLLDEGADIIMPVGGQINLGAGAAMEDIGMGASGDIFGALIGVDTDAFVSAPEFADLWLTSVEKALALTVANSILQTASDTFVPGNTRGFLSNDGVGLSAFHNFDSIVSAETKAEVEQLRADIIAGTQSVSGG